MRRAILTAAAEEFAAKGFAGGSMRSVARAVGVELANIQAHFRNKDILWSAVLSDIIGAYRRSFDAVLAESADRPPEEGVARFIESLVRHGAEHPTFVAIMAQPRNEMSEHARVYQRELGEGMKKVIVLIRRAQENGRLVEGDAGLLFYQMAGAAMRIFSAIADAKVLIGRAPLHPATVQEHIDLCIRLFVPDHGRRSA